MLDEKYIEYFFRLLQSAFGIVTLATTFAMQHTLIFLYDAPERNRADSIRRFMIVCIWYSTMFLSVPVILTGDIDYYKYALGPVGIFFICNLL
jgi:hypothetical protein